MANQAKKPRTAKKRLNYVQLTINITKLVTRNDAGAETEITDYQNVPRTNLRVYGTYYPYPIGANSYIRCVLDDLNTAAAPWPLAPVGQNNGVWYADIGVNYLVSGHNFLITAVYLVQTSSSSPANLGFRVA